MESMMADNIYSICKDDNSFPIDKDDEHKSVTKKKPKKCHANWAKNKNVKIIIIGAGPAGIHMASQLLQKGYKNVCILERNAEYTSKLNNSWNEHGKSVTIKDEELECVHELGTVYLHPKYSEIFKLIDKYCSDNKIISFPNTEYEVIVKNNNNKKYERIEWNDWMEVNVEKLLIPEILQKWLPDKMSLLSVKVAADKYVRLHKEIFGNYDDEMRIDGEYNSDSVQFPPKPSPKYDINMTMLQWMIKHNLQALIPNFMGALPIQGYGNLYELPAFYGLWWCSASLIKIGSNIKRFLKGETNEFLLKKGFYYLWQSIIEKDKIKIKYECNIKNINRYIINKDHPIEIKYKNCKNNNCDEIIECDVLFTAIDLSTFLDSFNDLQKDEKEIFGSLKGYTLCCSLIERDIEYDDDDNHQPKRDWFGGSLFVDNLLKADGGLYATRNCSLILNKDKDTYWKLIEEKQLKRV